MNKTVYENNLISNVVSSIERYGGKNCLSSIILTGSFGRNEPTYFTNVDGKLQLKSDVEIALVFPKTSQKKMIKEIIQKVSSNFEEELNLMAINEKRIRKVCNFNFSIKIPKYKTIFTYDLFNGSKTIWGQDFISEKRVSLSDVDVYEAKRLVANRIGELVYLQSHTENKEKRQYLREQWKGKLILAIVSAWLICEGEYVSSYHGQYQKIKGRVADVEYMFGNGFFHNYDKVFKFLREEGTSYEVPDEDLIEYVKRIDCYFRKNKIETPKINSISRVLKYMLKYAKIGMKYGIVGFENNILQALISHYWTQSDDVITDANVWHMVLY